ncbi:uncharacterized protein JCM6883_002346 [Sporobolomyces salmoneus]|uniref:uncharacterized protein n=1 Tax=Sporobolomyces salmoneus TaxID=183962 RepID=UPI00317DF0EB
MTSSSPSLLEKQDHLANSGANSYALSDDSTNPVESISYTLEEEKALVRKLDWKLIPGLTFLYLLSFLDRSNIGNAKAAGMMTDIGLQHKPEAYNTALALFFLGYVLFEIPANIVLKKFNPKLWLPTLTIAFGTCATLQCLVRNEPGFYAARFFMGVAEAGLFPGIVFVLSMFYQRKERTIRVSFFFGGAALAGAFGGLLGWGLATPGHINGGGLPGWAWLFAIEGMFTVLIGVSAYWWIPGYPREAKFLSDRERSILISRLQSDGDSGDEEPFSWNGVWQALKDPLVNAYGWLFHAFAFSLYSLSLFLPSIIAELGFASWKAQLMTVPVYATAFVAILFFVFISRKIYRGPAIAIAGLIGIAGYIVILTTHTPGSRYAGVFIAVIGIYSANALLLSWPSENVSPQTKRATSTGMQIFIGDIGAIAGVLIYRPDLSQNFYRLPHGIAILYTTLGVLLALSMSWRMHLANKEKNEGRASRAEKSGQEPKGDRSRGYLFQI